MKQLDEFKELLQDMLRKLDNIGKLLQQLVDAQPGSASSIKVAELDRRLGEYLNWTGQTDDLD